MKKFNLILLLPAMLGAQNQMELSIQESVQLALERNPNIRIAEEKINDARQSFYQAIGSALPSVNLQGTRIMDEKVQVIQNPFAAPGAPATLELDFTMDYQYDVRVTQPLFTGGKIALGTLMASKGATLVKSQYEQERNNLSFNVIQAYLGMLVTKEFLSVAEEGYATALEFYEISKLLYEQGMISKLDLLQAEVQAANLLPQKTQAENGVAMAHAGLKMLLGVEAETEILLSDVMSYNPGQYDIDQLKVEALTNRAEVHQMELSKSLSSLNVNMARSDFLPAIALSYSYSKSGNDLDIYDDWNDSYMVAVGFSYPIFSGGTRYSKVRQAKIAQRQLNHGYEAMKDGILFEVEQVYLSLMEAEKNILSQEKTVGQAEEAARLAKIQFREGTITNLQANQIQINLTAAKANYLQALFNYTLAEASIKKVIGEPLHKQGVISQ
ncbi:MAG: TolC family protein [Candidatus Marinimicrobia bacterium]|nr:TolC family protein [FCB group bacterium]MBL7024660.1 TolC family protein [Candidatus Neomarinimicrobiota bacterium]